MRGLLFVLCAGSAVAAIPNAVKDEFVPSPYEQTRIGGLLGERMKINLEKRLLRVDEKALVEGFQTRPGKHPWIGEHPRRHGSNECARADGGSIPSHR